MKKEKKSSAEENNKQDLPVEQTGDNQNPTEYKEENQANEQRERQYYYDDAHGYEIYRTNEEIED